jgi:hypothetical protein
MPPPRTGAGRGGYQRRYAARDPGVKLIIDHAVPISVMVGALFAGNVEPTREGIGAHLTRWYRLGLLCHDEDARLKAKGLRSTKPAGWDGKSLFARYEAAGIETCNNTP